MFITGNLQPFRDCGADHRRGTHTLYQIWWRTCTIHELNGEAPSQDVWVDVHILADILENCVKGKVVVSESLLLCQVKFVARKSRYCCVKGAFSLAPSVPSA